MTVTEVCTIVTSAVAVGGILIYVGRSLGTLQSIGDAVKVALSKTDQHEKEISELKVGLAQVKTRQDDCGSCP